MRFVIANVLLFAVYTGIAMLATWLYVEGGQTSNAYYIIMTLCQSSAVPVACIVNWRLVRLRDPGKRVLLGIGLGLLACAIALVPYFVIIIAFHMAIGGRL